MSEGKHIEKDKATVKKALAFISVVIACLALLASGSLAYYVTDQRTHNVITSGNIKIELHEYSDLSQTTAYPTTDAVTIMPSNSITKVVVVENTGTGEAWVRVKVDEVIDSTADDLAMGAGLIQPDYNTAYWTQKTDGCWYYNTPLSANSKTEPLFTYVHFSEAIGNSYQGDAASIAITAQAVQAANNAATDGWPNWN